MSNGGECRYVIGQNAYIKLVLHALKHKTSAVNGVLLGRLSGDIVEITDSVPLFHSSQIGLLPPLEIALIMVCLNSPLSELALLDFRFYVHLLNACIRLLNCVIDRGVLQFTGAEYSRLFPRQRTIR